MKTRLPREDVKSSLGPVARVAFVMSAAALTACVGLGPRPNTTRHYVLEASRPPKTQRTLEGSLTVGDFEAAVPCANRALCERKSAVEVSYPRDHLWIDRPQRLVTLQTIRWLRATKLFTRVTDTAHGASPTWSLSGELEALELRATGERWATRLAMSISVTEVDTGKVQFQRRWDLTRASKGASHADAVVALSASFRTVLAEISEALPRHLKTTAAPEDEVESVAKPRK